MTQLYIQMYIASMDYITTTELRTRSSELVRALKAGKSIKLIHRSQVVGKIEPKQNDEPGPLTREDIEKLKKLATKMNLPSYTFRERERRYRANLEKKYGKGIPRR